MQNTQIIESLRSLIKALGVTQEELFPTSSKIIMGTEDDEDDVSLLTGKAASSHLVRKQSTTQPKIPTSTSMLEELKNVRSWDFSAYGGKISQVMKDGETPNFDDNNLSTVNSVDTMVDASIVDDDFGGLN